MIIKKANACYTGGGVYTIIGQISDDRWFMTDTANEYYILIVDAKPDWDESWYTEWQEDHVLEEIVDLEAMAILNEALAWILINLPKGNYLPSDIKDIISSEIDNQIEK